MKEEFLLRFDLSQIPYWARRYKDPNDAIVEREVVPYAKAFGCLNQKKLVRIAHWKSPRSSNLCNNNDEDFVREVTLVAFSSPHERLKIEVLTLLSGIDWKCASAILHFCSQERYPVLDFRALWSLTLDDPDTKCFEFWWRYTLICRKLAEEAGVSMRDLDRALWQYSKEKQVRQNTQRTI